MRIFELFDVILNDKKELLKIGFMSCQSNSVALHTLFTGSQNIVIIGIYMELISQTISHSQDISQSSRAAFLVNVLKHEIMQLDNQTYITQQTFIRCNTRCFYHTASLFKRIMWT